MDSLPGYVSLVFILTTFAAIGFLLQAVKTAGLQSLPSKILLFLIPLWIIFQAVLALGGFYQDENMVPPRLFLFGVLPALLLIIGFFLFFRAFIERLPLRSLTLIHIVRIPVEFVLLWLSFGGQVPQVMTFEGRNFDIVSGILALVVYFIAFRGGTPQRWILMAFNIVGLVLLANIVSLAIMTLPSPMQQLAFDHPNRAVLFFPYIWLPTIVVPVVLFAHLSALWKLFRGRDQ